MNHSPRGSVHSSAHRGAGHCLQGPGLIVVITLAWAGCGGAATHQRQAREVPADVLGGMTQLANEFWAAALRDDSVRMRELSVGDRPSVWATRIRGAYPTFFQVTAGHLTLRQGYFMTARRDSAIVEMEVPWQTCRPPAHSGANDHYFVLFVPSGSTWRAMNIWSDPC